MVTNMDIYGKGCVYISEQRIERLRKKAAGLLEQPGVYKMLDKNSRIIYVGKAINLKRRVSSYFQRLNSHTPKTAALVSNIDDFDVMLANNELEALLLENNLIKQYKPKYNILLKDDKGYPFIKVTLNERYPKVLIARKRISDGARYFGPFIGSHSAYAAIDAVSKAFALPSCSNPEPKEGKRPCLYYRIKRCIGLCSGNVAKEDYDNIIKQIISFFEGNIDIVTDTIRNDMERAAENLDFEKAAVLRDRMQAVKALKEKQRVVASGRLNADYISVAKGEKQFCIFIMKVRKGILAGDRADFYPLSDFQVDFTDEYIKRFYSEFSEDIPGKICFDGALDDKDGTELLLSSLRGGSVRILNPKSGTDFELTKMSGVNAAERLTHYEGRTDKASRALFELSNITGVNPPPSRMEIYDISEIAGTGMVCGMAVFKDGMSDKSAYRKFKIETAAGGDDPAAMSEALHRRLERFRSGDESFAPLPDLIFADGGQIQVNALSEVIRQSGYDIPVFGLKKDSHHRTKTLVYPDGHEIMLFKYPAAFALCGKMQEEAHRFAIEYHRKLRSKKTVLSALTDIDGIGKARAAALLKHFKTIQAIKAASIDELTGVKGITKAAAEKVKAYFENENQ